MKCASCEGKIEGNPVWMEEEVYCFEKCAEIGSLDNEFAKDEKAYSEVDGEETGKDI